MPPGPHLNLTRTLTVNHIATLDLSLIHSKRPRTRQIYSIGL